MIHLGRALLLAVVAMLVPGCIHLEQQIKVYGNGSAVITYEYSVAEETFGTTATGRLAIQRWQGNTQGGLDWFASEKAVNEFFAGDDFEVQLYRVSRKGGRRHVRVVLLVQDLSKALATGKLGDLRVETTPEGNWRLFDPTPQPAGEKLTTAEVEKLRALCDDLWLRLTIQTPGKVVSTTAPAKDDREVTWSFDAGTDDSFLRERPRIEVVFAPK
jgi:hypothetical protein